LKNLADMTHEVGDLVTDHGDRLGNDLSLATKVTSAVLRNRASVEEALTWLPVVGKGAAAAFHGGDHKDVDVRDNATARLECALLDSLPPGPIKDQLKQICEDQTGEPPRSAGPTAPTAPTDQLLDCHKAVRKVKRQLHRVANSGLTQGAVDEILDPLKKQLKKLKKACDKVGGTVDPSEIFKDLPQLPDLPPLPDVPSTGVDTGPLTGNAAGTTAGPTNDQPSTWDSFTGWLGGLFSFIGVGG
jgi:hypothetical protein